MGHGSSGEQLSFVLSECPLIVELWLRDAKGNLCPRLPTEDKTPKRTVFLDFSNVKGSPYLTEMRDLLSKATLGDPHAMVGYVTKNAEAKKAPRSRGTKRANQSDEEKPEPSKKQATTSGAPPGEEMASAKGPRKQLKKARREEAQLRRRQLQRQQRHPRQRLRPRRRRRGRRRR